jgi:hypothetical protein
MKVHQSGAFWIAQLEATQRDTQLLTPAQIVALNRRNEKRPWAFQDVTRDAIAQPARIAKELKERQAWLAEKFRSGKYREGHKGMMDAAQAVIDGSTPVNTFRLLVSRADLRCIPSRAAMVARKSHAVFDRNQCSGLRVATALRVLRRSASGNWFYVHAGHSVGWLYQPQWSPPLSAQVLRQFVNPTRRMVTLRGGRLGELGKKVALGVSFPLKGQKGTTHVQLPTVSGINDVPVTATRRWAEGFTTFSRRWVFQLAFSQIGRAYGWGDQGGKVDCSGFLMDLFAAFGVRLGRHSSDQVKSGTATRDVKGWASGKKRALIRDEAEQGVVLLYFPGHIMLYLGQHQGRQYAISAIYELHSSCPGKGDTEVIVARTLVTDLSAGVGTQRGAFLERITRVARFGY